MRFLGIDLGWQSGASGLCCLELVDQTLALVALTRRDTKAEVLDWVDAMVPTGEPAMIAIDAPTVIPNATGMRLPDRLAHRYFGKYDAGCYPANQGRPFAETLVQFSQALEARGFAHAPTIIPQQVGLYQIELFPHPATIHLFHLDRILKYKKGRLAQRRPELEKLRSLQLKILPTLAPALALAEHQLPGIPTGGAQLKAVEDQLDSVICAYAGAHWWWWGLERNWVLGSLDTGYIVVPAPDQGPQPVRGAADECG
ncbi:MAG: DUF429 domain-containing protein [Leptolyngbya sp. RL_3_1]|nr:DUF429 domain-containing protein [Leptolyngbya sp. RL_3_1]